MRSRKYSGNVFSTKATNSKQRNETKPPTTMQSPGECREGWVKPVPRAVGSKASWQRQEHGRVRRQRIDKEATKNDRRTGKQTGGGEGETRGDYGAGTSPAGALAHVPCCHTKGDTGGGRRDNFFSFFSPSLLAGWHALALMGDGRS